MALTTKILLLFLLLHVSTSTTTTSGATIKPPQSILNVAETLSNSGYNAMSLTLQSILSDSSFLHLTRFAPEAIQTTTTHTPGLQGGSTTTTARIEGGAASPTAGFRGGSTTTTARIEGGAASTTGGGGGSTITTARIEGGAASPTAGFRGGTAPANSPSTGGRGSATTSTIGVKSGATTTSASAVTSNKITGATTATTTTVIRGGGGRGSTTTSTISGGATSTTDGIGGGHLTLTIFTPPDSAFIASGQPSLSQLLLHFVPLSLSISSLSSLPFGTKIHTLSTSALPLVTTSAPGDSKVEINEVAVLGSPIYDDGFVVVFGVEDFFKLNYTIEGTNQNARSTTVECSDLSPFSTLMEAVGKLKSRGYSIMASFLELQMMGYMQLSPWPLKLTMFAPEDAVLLQFSGDIPSYSGLFLRHMLACKLSFADLNGVENGTVFSDNFEGLSIVIERTDRDFFVNGVEITSPDLYYSDWIAIHGIRDTISEQSDEGIEDEELEEEGDEDDEHSVSYNEEALGPDSNEL